MGHISQNWVRCTVWFWTSLRMMDTMKHCKEKQNCNKTKARQEDNGGFLSWILQPSSQWAHNTLGEMVHGWMSSVVSIFLCLNLTPSAPMKQSRRTHVKWIKCLTARMALTREVWWQYERQECIPARVSACKEPSRSHMTSACELPEFWSLIFVKVPDQWARSLFFRRQHF